MLLIGHTVKRFNLSHSLFQPKTVTLLNYQFRHTQHMLFCRGDSVVAANEASPQSVGLK